jgi:hypothetical protein
LDLKLLSLFHEKTLTFLLILLKMQIRSFVAESQNVREEAVDENKVGAAWLCWVRRGYVGYGVAM